MGVKKPPQPRSNLFIGGLSCGGLNAPVSNGLLHTLSCAWRARHLRRGAERKTFKCGLVCECLCLWTQKTKRWVYVSYRPHWVNIFTWQPHPVVTQPSTQLTSGWILCEGQLVWQKRRVKAISVLALPTCDRDLYVYFMFALVSNCSNYQINVNYCLLSVCLYLFYEHIKQIPHPYNKYS